MARHVTTGRHHTRPDSGCPERRVTTGRPLDTAALARSDFVLQLLLVVYYFNNFCLTSNYLHIYQTDLRQVCRVGRTLLVDDQPEISFPILQGTLPRQPFFCLCLRALATELSWIDIRQRAVVYEPQCMCI